MSCSTKSQKAIKKIPPHASCKFIAEPPTLYIIFKDGVPKTVAKEWGAKNGYQLHDADPFEGHKAYTTMIDQGKDYDVMCSVIMEPEATKVIVSVTINDRPVTFMSLATLDSTKIEQVKQTKYYNHFVHHE